MFGIYHIRIAYNFFQPMGVTLPLTLFIFKCADILKTLDNFFPSPIKTLIREPKPLLKSIIKSHHTLLIPQTIHYQAASWDLCFTSKYGSSNPRVVKIVRASWIRVSKGNVRQVCSPAVMQHCTPRGHNRPRTVLTRILALCLARDRSA